MFESFIRTALFAALLAAVAPTRTAVSAGERGAVASARPGRATPWVRQHAGERDTVIPLTAIPMLAGVQPSTPYYEIDPDVVESGFFYYYYVRGKRQEYLVESTVRLYRLLHELAVAEELAKYDPAGEFFVGIGVGVKHMGVGLGHLIGKPGQTFRDFGRGIARRFKKQPKPGKDEMGKNRSLLGEGPAGAERRSLAYAYGLDVYTDNPEIQHILNVLARARATGSAATTWVLPGGALASFSGGGWRDDSVEKIIRNLDPKGVRQEAGKRLGRLFNMKWNDPATPLGRFLFNPNFTPHQIAYLEKCLVDMAQIRDLALILTVFADSDSPEVADYNYLEFRLYHVLHTKIRPLAELCEQEYMLSALGRDGGFFLLFPGDVLNETTLSPADIDEFVEMSRSRQPRALVIGALGVVDPAYEQALRRRGIMVHQNLLGDPRFFSTEY